MFALDTNVLVRLLTRDDERQAEKVRVLFERHADQDAAFFVSDVVLAELAWTLERTYDFDRETVGSAFKALADNATLAFESREILRAAQLTFETTKAGFADCLIAAQSKAAGCSALLTFDKGMRMLPGVDLL